MTFYSWDVSLIFEYLVIVVKTTVMFNHLGEQKWFVGVGLIIKHYLVSQVVKFYFISEKYYTINIDHYLKVNDIL